VFVQAADGDNAEEGEPITETQKNLRRNVEILPISVKTFRLDQNILSTPQHYEKVRSF
jgi:hypothetical protein